MFGATSIKGRWPLHEEVDCPAAGQPVPVPPSASKRTRPVLTLAHHLGYHEAPASSLLRGVSPGGLELAFPAITPRSNSAPVRPSKRVCLDPMDEVPDLDSAADQVMGLASTPKTPAPPAGTRDEVLPGQQLCPNRVQEQDNGCSTPKALVGRTPAHNPFAWSPNDPMLGNDDVLILPLPSTIKADPPRSTSPGAGLFKSPCHPGSLPFHGQASPAILMTAAPCSPAQHMRSASPAPVISPLDDLALQHLTGATYLATARPLNCVLFSGDGIVTREPRQQADPPASPAISHCSAAVPGKASQTPSASLVPADTTPTKAGAGAFTFAPFTSRMLADEACSRLEAGAPVLGGLVPASAARQPRSSTKAPIRCLGTPGTPTSTVHRTPRSPDDAFLVPSLRLRTPRPTMSLAGMTPHPSMMTRAYV